MEVEGEEPVDPLADGTRFYSRVMDEIRKHQGLEPARATPVSRSYDLARNYAENKDHYDLRELLIRLSFVLAHLAELTPRKAADEHPVVLTAVKPTSATSGATLYRPYSLGHVPRMPEHFENPEMLLRYLRALTTRRYVSAMKHKRHLVQELIRDLLRPNSPDTAHCRSTEAYNIGIKYFIHTHDLKSARLLLDQMKTDRGIKPNTETYNILFSAVPRALLGGKREYSRYYYNYYVRNQHLTLSPEYSGQFTKSNLPVTARDVVYFHHPLEFLITNLKEMAKQGIPANDETWNVVLCCARGLVAKSHVLNHMHELRIPLNDIGLKSVVIDTADFMGPQKVIELIQEEQFVATVNTAKAVIQRMIDMPSTKNLNGAWAFLLSVSEGTSTAMTQTIKPTTSILNTFASRFARAGRIDWILGVMQAMRTQWGVHPNLKTYEFMMEACVRQPPHANKAALLRTVYVKMMRLVYYTTNGSRSANVVLPPVTRYWMRRARVQFEFLDWLKKTQRVGGGQAQIEDAFGQAEAVPTTVKMAPSSAVDPFNINTRRYAGSQQAVVDSKFWQTACEQLAWPTDPNTPPTLRYTPPTVPTAVLDTVKRLGIRKPQLSAYRAVKEFESSPKDLFPDFVPEWKEFYRAHRERFRRELDKNEMKRREKFLADPYNAYLDDLRHEFELCK